MILETSLAKKLPLVTKLCPVKVKNFCLQNPIVNQMSFETGSFKRVVRGGIREFP